MAPSRKRAAPDAAAPSVSAGSPPAGGAKSFNRFGGGGGGGGAAVSDRAAAENAVARLRKLGIATPVKFADVAGCDQALQQLRESIELPMRRPQLFSTLGVTPPIGSVLYGPPGCGKTLIARALGNEFGLHMVTIDAPTLITDLLGESELMLRAAFAEAAEKQPSCVFIEQLDAVAPKRGRDSGTSVESRVVSTLLSCMDGVHAGWVPPAARGEAEEEGPWAPTRVFVLGTTRTSANSIDPALRRAGRFEREICVRCPDAEGRREILQALTRDVVMDDGVDLTAVADEAQGWVGADLSRLVKQAGLACIREHLQEPDGTAGEASPVGSLSVRQRHFSTAAAQIGCPSALREHVRTDVVRSRLGMADVGGIDAQRRDLTELVSYPLLHVCACASALSVCRKLAQKPDLSASAVTAREVCEARRKASARRLAVRSTRLWQDAAGSRRRLRV